MCNYLKYRKIIASCRPFSGPNCAIEKLRSVVTRINLVGDIHGCMKTPESGMKTPENGMIGDSRRGTGSGGDCFVMCWLQNLRRALSGQCDPTCCPDRCTRTESNQVRMSPCM